MLCFFVDAVRCVFVYREFMNIFGKYLSFCIGSGNGKVDLCVCVCVLVNSEDKGAF